MLTNQTLNKLHEMKLTAMADSYQVQRSDAGALELSFDERFGMLVDREWISQKNRSMERRVAAAKFKQKASIEDVDWAPARNLNRDLINTLSGDEWLRFGRNVVITGATGVGKSWLACALGHKACLNNSRVLYQHTPALFRSLFAANADGTLTRLLRRLAKLDLMIIDDWGLAQVKRGQYRDVLELLDNRQGSSHIFTSQYPVESWYEIIDDPTVADAIIDRVTANAYIIELEGDSMRPKYS